MSECQIVRTEFECCQSGVALLGAVDGETEPLTSCIIFELTQKKESWKQRKGLGICYHFRGILDAK